MTRWELATTGRAALGEGPVWDPSDGGFLWFVDIRGHTVHRLHPATGIDEQRDVRQPAGGAIPRTDGGLVLMLADGIHLYSWDAALPQRLLALGDDDPPLLMN